MIVSDIRHWQQEVHLYPEAIRKGLEYVLKTNFEALEPGKYPIDGDAMFMLYQEIMTEPKEARKPESHQSYVDIQVLLSGEERIGVSVDRGNHKITEDLLSTRDVAFYKDVYNESEILLKPGMFAVFFPSDIHRPCCNVDAEVPIRKAVIKIHKQLLS